MTNAPAIVRSFNVAFSTVFAVLRRPGHWTTSAFGTRTVRDDQPVDGEWFMRDEIERQLIDRERRHLGW